MTTPPTTLGLKAAQHSLLRLAENLGEASSNIRDALKDYDQYDNLSGAISVTNDAIDSLFEMEMMSSNIREMLDNWNQYIIESHQP